jgi:hypothetical protein
MASSTLETAANRLIPASTNVVVTSRIYLRSTKHSRQLLPTSPRRQWTPLPLRSCPAQSRQVPLVAKFAASPKSGGTVKDA